MTSPSHWPIAKATEPSTVSFLDGIVGSFSTGAADNPTVAMMDAAFAAEGLSWRYVNCEVEPASLDDAVAGAQAMGWQGFNCSMPHKQSVIPHLSTLSPSAELCQAVNCVVRSPDDGKWIGHNTDGAGMVASISDHTVPTETTAMVIGTGGAANAIGVELALAGVPELHVAGRNPDRAAALARLIESGTDARADVADWPSDQGRPLAIPAGVKLVVNATPVGMVPETAAVLNIDWATIGPDTVVADVVFNPAETTFLRAAAKTGASTIDGTGMLVNQAAENIRLWTGVRPQMPPIRQALEQALGL